MKKLLIALVLLLPVLLTACVSSQDQTVTTAEPAPTADGLPWGITFTAVDVTPEGLTVQCRNTFPLVVNAFETGSGYVVERRTENGWEEAPLLPGREDAVWTMEARIHRFLFSEEFNENWSDIYGSLPAGEYRLCKEFAPVDGGEWNVYEIPFTIGDEQMLFRLTPGEYAL